MSANGRFTSGPPDVSAGRGTIAVVASLALLVAGPPARACDIEVGAGSIVVLNVDATVDCIHVAVGGQLYIGQTLTLTGPDPSTVHGLVCLCASTSQLAFTTNNRTVSGSGCIRGWHEDASIYVDEDITLTNATTIGGKLQIYGPGNFTNRGVVNADSNGMLKIAVAGTLDDTAGDRWKATMANAVLSFDSALTTISTDGKLSGNFVVSGASSAEIENHESGLTTEGALIMSNGVLDVIESLTMGDDDQCVMQITDDDAEGSPRIDVAAGKTFTHY